MDPTSPLEESIAAELERLPFLAAAWLFGSLARGDATPESDLDLAVLPVADLSGEQKGELRELASRLQSHSPSGRVDILVLGPQGPVIRHRILREGRLLLDADPELRFDYEGRTISEYLDWKPTHEIAMRSSLRGIRERLERGGQ